MKRRGNDEGQIRRRSDGRWEVRVRFGNDIDGTSVRKCRYAPTKDAAVKLLAELRQDKEHRVSGDGIEVGEWLDKWFTKQQVACDWKPSTAKSYRGAIDRYLKPAFGKTTLERLTALQIEDWLVRYKKKHGMRRCIEVGVLVLRQALDEAVRFDYVRRNVAKLVRMPKRTARRKIEPLTRDEARALLDEAQHHRLGALFRVALSVGLRLGEATGLKWCDVDLDTGLIKVRRQLQSVGAGLLVEQSLKTEASRRNIVLPARCVEELQMHYTRQLEARLKAGDEWNDGSPEAEYVFTTYSPRKGGQVGGPLHPRNVLRALHRVCDKAGIRRIRFHDLRHSTATLLIDRGDPLVDVSQLLGHADIRTTANIYTDWTGVKAARVAQHMDEILQDDGQMVVKMVVKQ